MALCAGLGACGGDPAGEAATRGGGQGDTRRAPPVRPLHPVTVSGVSSGGYMAVQVHVALSDRVDGAGIIAAGPYHCARGSVREALGTCLSGEELDTERLVTFAREAAAAGAIAPVDGLDGDRVWLFHSPQDSVVAPAVGDAAARFYEAFLADGDLRRVHDVPAAHGWPTRATGAPCDETGSDFINACGFDAAGELLRHLYGDLRPPSPADPGGTESGGTLIALDLAPWLAPGSGMAQEGFAFVPRGCATPTDCRLHISFHGCQQQAERLEARFARGVGLNEWAAANDIVVLYPQISRSLMNPQGCWDWWGYTGDAYDQRAGRQVTAISAMIDAFAEGRLLP
jgi:hypothetical protein